MNFQTRTWLYPSTWLSCLWGPAKNELSWRECAGSLGARKSGAEQTLLPRWWAPQLSQPQNPAVPVRSLARPHLLLYTPGKGSFCCYSFSSSSPMPPQTCLLTPSSITSRGTWLPLEGATELIGCKTIYSCLSVCLCWLKELKPFVCFSAFE